MTWQPFYAGHGRAPEQARRLDPAPPWREFPRRPLHNEFVPLPGLVEAVNAALLLRRPLLLTGPAGSGKSTVIEQVAVELGLGPVLRWHITSRSTLSDALYRYDALGRIHAQRLEGRDGSDDITPFLRMGPLGTALLPSKHSRALLVDEIDKSDLDLPSDLLDALERGEFEIPELARYTEDVVHIREWDGDRRHQIVRGRVQCSEFPFIVMTSNGEREFPAAFLRRCVRFTMPQPTVEMLTRVVTAHLDDGAAGSATSQQLIATFVARLEKGENLAVDQLLNAVYLLSTSIAPDEGRRRDIEELLLRELSRA
ncbi:AAA family ATPase [Streptomyces lonarensis]|uniref:AAA domain-containing protein n=1 Tax=Streptomyces lonarensis TaxID=700599 RepID=A0A7X6CZV3_9ACTN|nr:AAA family ATPase [Streptomyces lonarensis]NJQ05616.1 AAA domain-containing protein [Streptomyces lonarensis]